MIDIHCHVLPGVDDGPRTWEQSIALARAMSENGIVTAVATPHLIDGVYANTRDRVEPLTKELNERLQKEGIPLTVLPGAEVDIACRHVTNASGELPLLGGHAALLEMPVAVIPHAMAEIIFSLRSRGILPVLAHPERNELVQERVELVRDWIDTGAAIQVDGDSLLGVWGRDSKRCAQSILAGGLCHALASDAHSCDKRPPRLAEAVEKAAEIIGDHARLLVTRGPEAILAGECPLTPMYPVHKRSRRKTDNAHHSDRGGGFLSRFLGRQA